MKGLHPLEAPTGGRKPRGKSAHKGLNPPCAGGNVRRIRRRKRRMLDWFRSGSRLRRRADASETKGGGEVARGP